MHDLEYIKRRNEAPGVGDKLGDWNGSPALLGVGSKAFWRNRRNMQASKRAHEDSDPAEGWENPEYADYEAFRDRLLEDAGRAVTEPHFSPVLEKVIL